MTDASLREEMETVYETELSRLGSSKALYAITRGEMETEAVLSELADRAVTATETFDSWTGDDAYGDVFTTAAETARDHAARIVDAAEDAEPIDSPTPADEVLRGVDASDERLGGLLAWTLIADRTFAQAVGFFVGSADTMTSDLFRSLRSDVGDLRSDADEHVAGADRDAALGAASEVVEAAYDHYADTLEEMGVKVKPVC